MNRTLAPITGEVPFVHSISRMTRIHRRLANTAPDELEHRSPYLAQRCQTSVHPGGSLMNRIPALCAAIVAFALGSAVWAADNSQYIGQNVPAVMISGQTYPVFVTMKNSGTTTWTNTTGGGAPNMDSLGSQNPQDNVTWGVNRVSVGGTVAPGATKTFNFNVVAPTTPGTYNFQWMEFPHFPGHIH